MRPSRLNVPTLWRLSRLNFFLSTSVCAFLLSAAKLSRRHILDVPNVIASRRVARRVHYPLISLSSDRQFRHLLFGLIRYTMPSQASSQSQSSSSLAGVIPPDPRLKKVEPYWYNYTTMAKGRWLGREILEIVSTEFRDRSMEYYVRLLFLTHLFLS